MASIQHTCEQGVSAFAASMHASFPERGLSLYSNMHAQVEKYTTQRVSCTPLKMADWILTHNAVGPPRFDVHQIYR